MYTTRIQYLSRVRAWMYIHGISNSRVLAKFGEDRWSQFLFGELVEREPDIELVYEIEKHFEIDKGYLYEGRRPGTAMQNNQWTLLRIAEAHYKFAHYYYQASARFKRNVVDTFVKSELIKHRGILFSRDAVSHDYEPPTSHVDVEENFLELYGKVR